MNERRDVRVSIPSVSGKTADQSLVMVEAQVQVSIPSVSGKTADVSRQNSVELPYVSIPSVSGKTADGPSKFLITFRYLQGCFKTDIDPFV